MIGRRAFLAGRRRPVISRFTREVMKSGISGRICPSSSITDFDRGKEYSKFTYKVKPLTTQVKASKISRPPVSLPPVVLV